METHRAFTRWVEKTVRKGGIEPPRRLRHRILNPARLPIPPLPRNRAVRIRGPVAGVNTALHLDPAHGPVHSLRERWRIADGAVRHVSVGGPTRIAKEQRTLTNRDKQPEDREASAALARGPRESPRPCVALLTRFDMNLENQLKDRAEKDFVFGLLAHGEGGAAYGVRSSTSLDADASRSPLRCGCYVELAGEEDAVEKVFDLLESSSTKKTTSSRRRRTICWCGSSTSAHDRGHRRMRFRSSRTSTRTCVTPRPRSCSPSRMTSARSLPRGGPGEPEEDSNRLRVRLAEAFNQRRWAITKTPRASRSESARWMDTVRVRARLVVSASGQAALQRSG